jgi:hypothetical protein
MKYIQLAYMIIIDKFYSLSNSLSYLPGSDSWWLVFILRSFHVGFVTESAVEWQNILQILLFSSVSIFPVLH